MRTIEHQVGLKRAADPSLCLFSTAVIVRLSSELDWSFVFILCVANETRTTTHGGNDTDRRQRLLG